MSNKAIRTALRSVPVSFSLIRDSLRLGKSQTGML